MIDITLDIYQAFSMCDLPVVQFDRVDQHHYRTEYYVSTTRGNLIILTHNGHEHTLYGWRNGGGNDLIRSYKYSMSPLGGWVRTRQHATPTGSLISEPTFGCGVGHLITDVLRDLIKMTGLSDLVDTLGA